MNRPAMAPADKPTTTYGPECGLDPEIVSSFSKNFNADERNIVARNAITNSPANKVALNREALINLPMTFSTEIPSGDITAQMRSGRCWMFAALNLLRLNAMKRMNLKTFELSQSYTMFWDKLEKANYFLCNVIDTLQEEDDSRLFAFLLQAPLNDGGQWDMFANLVRKYGVVPKEVYPESTSSSNTAVMNAHLTEKLRGWAAELRREAADGADAGRLHERRREMMETVYRILAIHNGEPPRSFNWSWRDKDEAFHAHDGEITPTAFLDEYVGFDLDDYVSLIHCPTPDKPVNRLYTVEYLGNVAEGSPVRYVNVDIDVLKKATLETLKSGEAVWFGCDVGKQLERELGLLDASTFRFDLLYNTTFEMDKGDRVTYRHSSMTHAMLFTGVHEEDGRTVRWKVENSWGKENGRDGFLIMSDDWFDEHLFQVLVPRARLDAATLALLDTEPTALKPWDPMGSLAD